MIEYFALLPEEEQQQLTEVIQTLLKQTFVLERKYEKRTGRFTFNREYRILGRHLEFLKEYFKIAGIEVQENIPGGVVYIRGEGIAAERLPKLATIYLLLLKLIYDEQMASASTSVNIFTSLGDINERLGSFQLLKDRPSLTEIRRTLTLLKRYQIIEVLDPMEELESETKIIIYPCISMVLMGEEAKRLLGSFQEDEEAETQNQPGSFPEDEEAEPEEQPGSFQEDGEVNLEPESEQEERKDTDGNEYE